jgi:peptidoglycan/xylan/chitin deacetylase (PgdA/CDA1 family)
MANKIFLSFDIEEFDIVEEFTGKKIRDKEIFDVSKEGLKKLLRLLDKHNARATFFVTAVFAQKYKGLIRDISKKHEVASHGFYHGEFSTPDLKKSKDVLEKIIGKKVRGFRMPRLKKIDLGELKKAGFEYDSSINPSYMPGRYNNLFTKRKPYKKSGIFVIPISTVPLIRSPITWLTIKNFPISLIRFFSRVILLFDRKINLYMHPWEFSDISKYNLPRYVKNPSGDEMLAKLDDYIKWLGKRGEFCTFSEY